MEDDEKEELEREKRRILQAIFGESDGDGDEEDAGERISGVDIHGEDKARWEQVEGISGLWLCREFLSPEHQSALLAAITNEGWFIEETQNQAMRFGDLPKWAFQLSGRIREASTVSEGQPIASHLLQRDPLFDQLIVNVYAPGEGICDHVDLMRFEDGIAVVSLESPCVMHFSAVAGGAANSGAPQARIPVLLPRGSLVFMSGDARYLWAHGIDRRPGFQIWQGTELRQSRRTSVTLRKLCPSE